MTTQSRHLHRLLSLFDPLLCRAPLVVEAHHRPAGCLQVGHDESDSGEQLPSMELHLRHYPTCCLPTSGLVEKALVPDHRLVAPSFLRAASTTPRCRAPGCRWRVCGWHTSRLASPEPRKSPAWQMPHRRETPLPYPVLVGARSPAITVLPSLPRCVRCPAAASPRDSRPRR